MQEGSIDYKEYMQQRLGDAYSPVDAQKAISLHQKIKAAEWAKKHAERERTKQAWELEDAGKRVEPKTLLEEEERKKIKEIAEARKKRLESPLVTTAKEAERDRAMSDTAKVNAELIAVIKKEIMREIRQEELS